MKISHSMQKSSFILAGFAIATTGLVTLTHLLTAPEIAKQQKLATQKNLDEIVSPDTYNNQPSTDCVIDIDSNGNTIKIFRARYKESESDKGKAVAAAIESIAPDGYSGRIDLLVALDMDNTILGVRTIKHKETPGLGDKIELAKSPWITHFRSKTIEQNNLQAWAVKKDGGAFDQFTGATITPRAVVNSVKRTSLWFANNKQRIFNLPSNCEHTK
ncbi:electron transport complex subunit RsxG [Saccharobesus litoralis]|uniref:Ion-translocating oxidoreductase complex subunit G n=1 Tax=Saccharobesus litoralis TaxID=2172099 RepID=A0A2S0VUG9_9ALTE|nr:electron transport complex subunit RsxG [Saccharobesus litoralis]AWB67867.1 electron transport complex subunit RsxG [Saccharobesus litoralis]